MDSADDDNHAPSPPGNPIYVYDSKLRDELRKSLPHLDIREPDGTEPDLHFVRVDAVQQISLPYDAVLSHIAEIKPRRDIIYRRLDAGVIVGA